MKGLNNAIYIYALVQLPLQLFSPDEIYVMDGIRVIPWGCLEGLTELTVDNGQEHHPTWKRRWPDGFSLCNLPCVGEPSERSSAIHVAEPSSISYKNKPCKSPLLSRERRVQVMQTFPSKATHECACKQIHKARYWLISLRTLTNCKSAVEDHKLTG